MKYTEAEQGRIFILRLEQGDRLPDTIETFAVEKEIKSALIYLLGGTDKGSTVISAPVDEGSYSQPFPLHRNHLTYVHETLGIGTVFLNESEKPVLHLHAAFGNQNNTVTGCIREGILVWKYMEIVLIELEKCKAQRKLDVETGFTLLDMP